MRPAPLLYGAVLYASLACTGAYAEPAYSRIDLIAASTALGDGQPLLLGIRIEPRPGWKTYWRAAGESGLPPVFTFPTYENAGKPEIRWPAPRRLIAQGQESYGYEGLVIFPFYVQPLNAARQVRVEVRVEYAVCMDICVPEQAERNLLLPPGPARATSEKSALQAALSRVPAPEGEAAFARIRNAFLELEGAQLNLRVDASSIHGFGRPDMFADGPVNLNFGRPQILYGENNHQAAFNLPVIRLDPGQSVVGQIVTLTLVDGEFAVEKQVKLAERTRTE
ncbi:MAG: hypothetical protein EXR08_11680 [Alphaproteobacteria bacterium]|nr:hypothetical protein [Alphaproteobacteria bacterium]